MWHSVKLVWASNSNLGRWSLVKGQLYYKQKVVSSIFCISFEKWQVSIKPLWCISIPKEAFVSLESVEQTPHSTDTWVTLDESAWL